VVPPGQPGNHKNRGVNAQMCVEKLHGFVITTIRTTGSRGSPQIWQLLTVNSSPRFQPTVLVVPTATSSLNPSRPPSKFKRRLPSPTSQRPLPLLSTYSPSVPSLRLHSVGGKPPSPPNSRTSPSQESCVHSHVNLPDKLAPPHTVPSPSDLPSPPPSNGPSPLSSPPNQSYTRSSPDRILNTSSRVANFPRLSPLSSTLSRPMTRSWSESTANLLSSNDLVSSSPERRPLSLPTVYETSPTSSSASRSSGSLSRISSNLSGSSTITSSVTPPVRSPWATRLVTTITRPLSVLPSDVLP